MSQDQLKKQAAEAALDYVQENDVVGVGTGSTVHYFIQALAAKRHLIKGAISSSDDSTAKLKALDIPVMELNDVTDYAVYVDGADEITEHLHMIKGGGAALTREKIVSAAARKFVCIIDQSKLVGVLGTFPLPVEVIPMARSFVARQLVNFGGRPVWRQGVITDNGNQILDVHDLNIIDPTKLEQAINNIPGVVTNGLFAMRGADVVLIGTPNGVKTLK